MKDRQALDATVRLLERLSEPDADDLPHVPGKRRKAIMHSLVCFVEFLEVCGAPAKHEQRIRDLYHALSDLDEGVVDPLLVTETPPHARPRKATTITRRIADFSAMCDYLMFNDYTFQDAADLIFSASRFLRDEYGGRDHFRKRLEHFRKGLRRSDRNVTEVSQAYRSLVDEAPRRGKIGRASAATRVRNLLSRIEA